MAAINSFVNADEPVTFLLYDLKLYFLDEVDIQLILNFENCFMCFFGTCCILKSFVCLFTNYIDNYQF